MKSHMNAIIGFEVAERLKKAQQKNRALEAMVRRLRKKVRRTQ